MENYTIYDEIGRGTHSFVYKARRKRSIEYVAVKSTAKSRMDKILNEVQLLHKLDSRHVLKFYNWYESQNHIWLIFEFCTGGDLLNLITQDKHLPESAVKVRALVWRQSIYESQPLGSEALIDHRRTQAFGWDLVAGLQYLHSNGILFCDLKPANILIDECGSLKLADFGLARRIPTADSGDDKPLAPGSPNYMAPELFQQPAVYSYASDFWALGCVLFELCTGSPPFTHTNFTELARIIQTEQPPLPPSSGDMSPAFADLLGRLLNKNPYDRITWDELLQHAFWNNLMPLNSLPMPSQDIFERGRPSLQRELQAESLSIAITDKDASPANLPHSNLASDTATSELESSRDSELTDTNDGEENEDPNQDKSDDTDESEDGDSSDGLLPKSIQVRPVTAPTDAAYVTGDKHIPINGAQRISQPSKLATQLPRVPQTAPPGQRKGTAANHTGRPRIKKVSRLIFCVTDYTVKPIAYSQDIETIHLADVDTDTLDFEIMLPNQLLACTTEDLEEHLKSIYLSLKSSDASPENKANVLCYLFSLSRHPKLANVIVNSSMLTLLIKLLQQSNWHNPQKLHHSHQSSHIMLVLSVLFRFATFISPVSPEHIDSLTRILASISEDSRNPYVLRRRAMSCLGELLFYSATQGADEITASGMNSLLVCASDQDQVTQHYAVQTVANILALCSDGSILCSLVDEHVLHALVRSLVKYDKNGSADNVSIRTTISQAIGQLWKHIRYPTQAFKVSSRLKAAAMVVLSNTTFLSLVWRGVDGEPMSLALSAASLNILNSYLECHVDREKDSDVYGRVEEHRRTLLGQIVSFTPLIRILGASKYDDEIRTRHPGDGSFKSNDRSRRYGDEEQGLPSLVRAKTLLFVHFGFHRSKKFAKLCVRASLVDHIERNLALLSACFRSPGLNNLPETTLPKTSLSRQPSVTDHYFSQCCLIVVRSSIRTALKLCAECLASGSNPDYEEGAIVDNKLMIVDGVPFELMNQLLKNSLCRANLVDFFLANEGHEFTFFVRVMTKLLTTFSNERLPNVDASVGQVISELLLRLFHGPQEEATLLAQSEIREIFEHLLPAVVLQLQLRHLSSDEPSHDDEHAANCIRLIYMFVLSLPIQLEGHEHALKTTLINNHLLPSLVLVLEQPQTNESVWQFVVDLLFELAVHEQGVLAQISTSAFLLGPIVAIISAPSKRGYHSLPPSAVELFKLLVDYVQRNGITSVLFEHHLADHLACAVNNMFGTDVLPGGPLEVLYAVLLSHYETMKRNRKLESSYEGETGVLLGTATRLVELCASSNRSSHQPQDSPTSSDGGDNQVADLASRCLVYLSQIFGQKLSVALFGASTKDAPTPIVAECICATLQFSDKQSPTLLRLLLTLKHCLRCDSSARVDADEKPVARQWLLDHSAIISDIKAIAILKLGPNDQDSVLEQVTKTANDILRLVHYDTNNAKR